MLSGLGEPLWNRLLVYDLRTVRFRTLNLRRNPECAVCGGYSLS